MKSLAVDVFKPPADFTILELATPQITSPDHVLIKVLAASLNPTDIALANGAFKRAVNTP
jgi:NADPH:quinone reductase-like Zn-dependent oxidoreductase